MWVEAHRVTEHEQREEREEEEMRVNILPHGNRLVHRRPVARTVGRVDEAHEHTLHEQDGGVPLHESLLEFVLCADGVLGNPAVDESLRLQITASN